MAASYRTDGEHQLLSGSSYSLLLINCCVKDLKANELPNPNTSAAASAGKNVGLLSRTTCGSGPGCCVEGGQEVGGGRG